MSSRMAACWDSSLVSPVLGVEVLAGVVLVGVLAVVLVLPAPGLVVVVGVVGVGVAVSGIFGGLTAPSPSRPFAALGVLAVPDRGGGERAGRRGGGARGRGHGRLGDRGGQHVRLARALVQRRIRGRGGAQREHRRRRRAPRPPSASPADPEAAGGARAALQAPVLAGSQRSSAVGARPLAGRRRGGRVGAGVPGGGGCPTGRAGRPGPGRWARPGPALRGRSGWRGVDGRNGHRR